MIVSDIWTWLIDNSSALMVILTGVTLIWSIRTQVRLDKQRNEDVRARIHVYLINDDLHTFLCISNIGKRSAWNIQMQIREDLVDVLPTYADNKDYIRILNEQSTSIEPGDKIYFLLDSTHRLRNICKTEKLEIKIEGRYCKTYRIDQRISINEFINHPPYKLFFKNKSD